MGTTHLLCDQKGYLVLSLRFDRASVIWYKQGLDAVLNAKTPDSHQICHPYTGNPSSDTPGDSRNAFLHQGGVIELPDDWACGGG